nr:hypothetical protein [Trentepohlia sp. YN1317]
MEKESVDLFSVEGFRKRKPVAFFAVVSNRKERLLPVGRRRTVEKKGMDGQSSPCRSIFFSLRKREWTDSWEKGNGRTVQEMGFYLHQIENLEEFQYLINLNILK